MVDRVVWKFFVLCSVFVLFDILLLSETLFLSFHVVVVMVIAKLSLCVAL